MSVEEGNNSGEQQDTVEGEGSNNNNNDNNNNNNNNNDNNDNNDNNNDNKEQQVDDKDPDVLTPQYERTRIKKIGINPPDVGEIWYAISRKWLQTWEEYTEMKKTDDDIVGGLDNMHNQGKERPGKIDNSDLSDNNDSNQLKQDIQEHLTHEWIPQEKWNCLFRWYGGGPTFGRQVFEKGNYNFKEKYICQFPRFIRFITCSQEGDVPSLDDPANITTKGYPKDYPLLSIANDFEKSLGLTDEKSDGLEAFVHLWVQIKELADVYPVTARKVEVKKEQIDEQIGDDLKRWVEIPDDYLKNPLDDTKLSDDIIIMIEPKSENGTWPRARTDDNWNQFKVGDIIDCKDTDGKWYESLVRLVGKADFEKENKIAVHYIGWITKWDDWLDVNDNNAVCKRHTYTKGPHRTKRKDSFGEGNFGSWNANENGSPEQKGIVGLRNLGNTCFMNSTIQCLAQSPWLTEYFLNNSYYHHINRNNPLGWKGKVAEAWAHLLQDMFSNKYRTVAPRAFKQAIGESAPRFMGYAQQDSQELLSFLLDGLHEDLNQIEKKPPTEAVESNGRSDKVVALESWKTYLKRNQSIIVDLLQGQFKSRVQCPTCEKISITFDPFMFLSVPLPTEKYSVFEYTYVSPLNDDGPKVYGEKILKIADIQMLKQAIAKKFKVPIDELFVCDVWRSKIHHELKDRDIIAENNRRGDDIFIFHSPKPKIEEEVQAEVEEVVDAKEDVIPKPPDQPAQPILPHLLDQNRQFPPDHPFPPDHQIPPDQVPPHLQNQYHGNNNNNNRDENNNNNNNRGEGNRGIEDDYEYRDNENYHQAGGPGAGGGGGGGGRNYHNYQPRVPDYLHIPIVHQFKDKYKQQGNYQRDDEFLGCPLLITLSSKKKNLMSELRREIFDRVKPYAANPDIKYGNDLPFDIFAQGYNMVQIDNKNEEVDITAYNLKFVLYWKDPQDYRFDLYDMQKRPRDESAPPMNNNNNNNNNMGRIGGDDDDDGYGKAVTLQQCIDAFTEEETLGENDAWYCSSCKDFKCANKQINLWNTPNLLIIHLKRFSYTRAWRDRINTLVKFPLEGLDLSDYVNDIDDKNTAIYDLYAVSNHMGGMGGGHYTAYAKNLYNKKWYHLDDSSTSEVNNTNHIISSMAYVLYYKRRDGKQIKQRASKVIIPKLEDLEKNNNNNNKRRNDNDDNNDNDNNINNNNNNKNNNNNNNNDNNNDIKNKNNNNNNNNNDFDEY